jgi:hypothetical protein
LGMEVWMWAVAGAEWEESDGAPQLLPGSLVLLPATTVHRHVGLCGASSV